MIPVYLLQTGNNLLALSEWFAASVALIIVVTLAYKYILNKSPPPEGITQYKVESSIESTSLPDPTALLLEAQNHLKSSNYTETVESAVKAVSEMLASALSSLGVKSANMNISDMAYLIQSRSPGSPDITQPIYQLNLLRLRSAQSQPISPQEAEWTINIAIWLSQLISTRKIAF